MLEIEMTGKEDRDGPWKIAIGGFPGAGKTLTASTAANPLYVFFSETPKIKSIADRFIPHVKIYNRFAGAGGLQTSVQDQLEVLHMRLQLQEHDYKTLVLDTGDELFQQMKEGRRVRNNGEWGPGDWGWIADAYREVVNGMLSLNMDVIVLYHLKNEQDGESGLAYRNLALQGAAVDETSGWFDIVGALDTFEVVDDNGVPTTKRVLLTRSSRIYPWVKDHSGGLPDRFEINFQDDIPRLLEYAKEFVTFAEDGQGHAVLETIDPTPGTPARTGAVPTPEDLAAKKAGHQPEGEVPDVDPDIKYDGFDDMLVKELDKQLDIRGLSLDGLKAAKIKRLKDHVAEEVKRARLAGDVRVNVGEQATEESSTVQPEVIESQPAVAPFEGTAESGEQPEPEEETTPEAPESEVIESQPAVAPFEGEGGAESGEQPEPEKGDPDEVRELTDEELAEVEAMVEGAIGAAKGPGVCVVDGCNVEPDKTINEIAKMRTGKVLCRDHLREAMSKENA